MSPDAQLRTGDLFDLAVGQHAVGDRLRSGFAQRVGLRLAAAFGHGFGKIGEQHREPQPERDLQVEAELALVVQRVAHQQNRCEHAADFHHEHDGIAHHLARIQLQRTNPRSRAARSSYPKSLYFLLDICSIVPQKVFPACISRCSRIGPRLSAGKERQRAHDHDHADQQHAEQRRSYRERSQRWRNILLLAPGFRPSPAWEGS